VVGLPVSKRPQQPAYGPSGGLSCTISCVLISSVLLDIPCHFRWKVEGVKEVRGLIDKGEGRAHQYFAFLHPPHIIVPGCSQVLFEQASDMVLRRMG
jgi:hypothetical protein